MSLPSACCASEDHQRAVRNLIRMYERFPRHFELGHEMQEPNSAISKRVTPVGRSAFLLVLRFWLGLQLSFALLQES